MDLIFVEVFNITFLFVSFSLKCLLTNDKRCYFSVKFLAFNNKE